MSLLGYVVYSKAGFLPTTEVKCDFSTMLPEHGDKKSLLKIVIKSNFFKGLKEKNIRLFYFMLFEKRNP